MLRLLLLIGLCCLAGAVSASATGVDLYTQIGGCEEMYLVEQHRVSIERLAQRKGLRWPVLVKQNKLKKPYRLKKGMTIKIDSTHIVPTCVNQGLIINLAELNLYYFKDGAYQRRYALAAGKPSWPTPTGNYKIIDKRKNPTWNVPLSIQEEMEEEGLEVLEKVPPGPKNPLGKFFMLTSAEGVGIHATNRPWSVGYYASHGCIRMLPDEIEKLFPEVTIGTPVKIIYQPIKMAVTAQGRIFLEAHHNFYQKKMQPIALVKELAAKNQLEDRIDWDLAAQILKSRDGVARDITRNVLDAAAGPPAGSAPSPQLNSVFPLQGKEAKLK